jgi:hypothetical protein
MAILQSEQVVPHVYAGTLAAPVSPDDGRGGPGYAYGFSPTGVRRAKERQLEGIAAAKARGVYKGRKPTIDPGAVRKLAAEGVGATEIARRLGIGRASVYRLGAAA